MSKELSQEIMAAIGKMGLPGKDRVTGFEGVIDTVALDLYGCVQYSIRPIGEDKDGKPKSAYYFDVSRVEVGGEARRVMEVPVHFYDGGEKGPTKQGASDKPSLDAREAP